MSESEHVNGYTEPDVVEKVPVEETVVETHGVFSGSQPQNGYEVQNPYGNPSAYDAQNPYGNPNAYGAQNPYGNPNAYGAQNPYGNPNAYGAQNPYGNQNAYGGQNPYGNQNAYGGQNPYGNPNAYGAQSPYGNQNAYGAQSPYGNQNAYGTQNPYENQNAYDGQADGNSAQTGSTDALSPYGEQNPYGSQENAYGAQNPYGGQAGGGFGGQPPFGGQSPYDDPYNPYSPYARPQKKQHTGLIVGIVVTIVILFIVAVIALASRAANLLSEKEQDKIKRDVYDMDDYDYDDNNDRHDYYHHEYDYDYDYDYPSVDDYYYDYDYDYGDDYDSFFGDGEDFYDYDNEQYYTLHDDLREDLSYSVDFSVYEYETDYENVYIAANLPTISGDDVPNLKTLNESIQKDVEAMTSLFEKDYESRVKEDSENNYFQAALSCYVTYMDEEKLSLVYDERIYCIVDENIDQSVRLICHNIDMKSGVVLDNKEMLVTDDDFSVEFRNKSDAQNGEIEYLTAKTDQQITDYFKSDNIIVFYTPKGMEIGFNYEEGWVTVTFEEYEKYLKVF